MADIEKIAGKEKIVLQDHTSREWTRIGHYLANKSSLVELEVVNCDCKDELLPSLFSSSSLRSLKFGTICWYVEKCKLTSTGYRFIVGMKRLERVTISIASTSFRRSSTFYDVERYDKEATEPS